MNIRLSILVLAGAALLSTSLNAQETASVALPFARAGLNPVTEAMGGADMLSLNTCSAAGVAAIPFSEARFDASGSLMYPLEGETTYYGGQIGARIGKRIGAVVSAKYGSDESYETFDESGNATGTFSPSRYAVSAGLAAKVIDWLSVGVNVRYTSETLYTDATTSAISADAVLMGKWKGMKAAAGILNIGGSVQDAAGRDYELATSATAALGYSREFGRHGIEAELKADYYLPEGLESPIELSAGASYTFAGIVSVRGGYHYAGETAIVPSFASAGLGLKLFGVHLDAAYRISKQSGNAVCAGLGYRF